MRKFTASILHRIALRLEQTAEAAYSSPYKALVEKWRNDNTDKSLQLEYNLTPNSLVYDVGGYEGQWASDIFSKHLCQVRVFEPIGAFADKIQKRFAKNSNITVYRFGLSGTDATVPMAVIADGSSTFREGAETETVEMRSVVSVMREQKTDRIDLMKLNIEGGEYDLLEKLIENNLQKKIVNFQIQFHKVAPNSEQRMLAIRKNLEKTHYLTYCYDFVWENWQLKNT